VSRVIRAELIKLRTARTYWGLFLTAVALLLLFVILPLILNDNFRDEDDTRSVLSSAGVSGLIGLVLGVVHSAGEYRHGTIASTLLATPDRLRAMSGQAISCAVAGVAIGAFIALLTAVIALPWLSARDATMLPAGDVLGLLAGTVLYAGLAAALGSGLGATLRNQVVAVVLVLVVLFVIDPTIAALVDGYSPYSLGGLTSTLSGTDQGVTGDPLPYWEAALIWTGYTLVLVSAASLLTSRRDI
jgi:ABC-2 type transport system permease protein